MANFIRYFAFVSFLLSVTLAQPLEGIDYSKVNLLRWEGPPGSHPGTFKEWIKSHPYREKFYIKSFRIEKGSKNGRTVGIIVDTILADTLSNSLNNFIRDLEKEGYNVLYFEVAGGTPDSLRNFLKDLYQTYRLEGAFLIGDLPVAWFQVENDFNYYGYAEWPVDLFYMDLDGEWLDTLKYDPVLGSLVPGEDSIYDAHTGELTPEIYIGRLLATGIGGDTLYINYFKKDSLFRRNEIELPHQALVYVDDDWFLWAQEWANDVGLLYDTIELICDSNTTRASDYRPRLDTVRAWVSVFAHSWPGGHAFYYSDHTLTDYYYASEYTTQNPPSNFYNFFSCSFGRYTESGYGAGRAVFTRSYGLGAVASTKTGSMLEFDYFYSPLGEGATMGEAFRDWFTYITQDGVDFYELCWHYGMTLLGDPFLRPTGHVPPPPSLVLPANGAFIKDTLVVMDWCDVDYISGYHLQVSGDSGFGMLVWDDTLNISTCTLSLQEGTYFWRVSSRGVVWSEWSEPWTFTVDISPPVISNVTIWHDTSFTGPYPINATIMDNYAVDSVFLWYRTSLNWIKSPMIGETLFVDTIPSCNPGDTVRYYLVSYDKAGNVSAVPSTSPDSVYWFVVKGSNGIRETSNPSLFIASPEMVAERMVIKYGVPEDGNVRITIYDVSGRRVKELINTMHKPGYYRIELECGLACGVYFLEIFTGKERRICRFVVMK